MKPILILAAISMTACDKLPAILGQLPVKLPTSAQICALSPETQAALADAMHTDASSLAAACEIVK